MTRHTPFRRNRSDRGAVAVEFAVLVPGLMLLIGLVVAGGRLAQANQTVQQMADSASRAASIARSAPLARADAAFVVNSDAADADLHCAGGVRTSTDVSGFSRPIGQATEVTVSVRCGVPLSDLLVPGLPGTWNVTATSSSPLDRYRGR